MRFRNWLVSFSLISLFTLPFFVPNKYYLVEVIRGFELALPEFKEGYFLGYGVNVSNLFLILAMVFSIKEARNLFKKYKGYFLNKLILISLTCFSLFFLVGFASSVAYSFFPVASIVWLVQYLQIVFFAWVVYVLNGFVKNYKTILLTTIIAMLFFQAVVVSVQFTRRDSFGVSVEFTGGALFNKGIDENNSISRPAGTFSFHNQLGLVALLLLPLLLNSWLEKPKTLTNIGIACALFLILLAQGRAVWVGCSFVLLFFFFKNKKKVFNFIRKTPKKYAGYFLVIAALAGLIFIPRLLNSFNVVHQGSGLELRLKMIQEGVQALSYQPIVGYGAGTNEYILFSLFPNGSMSIFPAAIHMGFLQLALEVGLAGLVLFLIPFWLAGRGLDSKKRFLYISLMFSAIVYYSIQPHVGIMEFPYVGIVLGTLWSNQLKTKK